MPTSRFLVVLVSVCLAGCPSPSSSKAPSATATPSASSTPAPAAAPPAASAPTTSDDAAPTTPGDSTSSVGAAMQRHDELAEKARAAVVAGDLETFKVALDYEAMQPLPGELPDKGAIFVERALAGAQVGDLTAAAAAIGSVGASCAGCHRAHPQLRFDPSGFEEGGDTLPERMQMHWWAAEAMWQGLVGPSQGAWDVGARTLADPALKGVPGFPKGGAAAGFADALRTSATAAQRADDDEARGEAFGQVIATCAGCHTALGRGPGFEAE